MSNKKKPDGRHDDNADGGLRVRYDAEGRAHNQCTCGRCDRSRLAPPKQISSLDELAQHVYSNGGHLTDEHRALMTAEVKRIDGEVIPADKHPVYVAGRYLHARRRAAEAEARKAAMKADAKQFFDAHADELNRAVGRALAGKGAPAAPRKNAEAEAREKMQRESREAWRQKKTK